jgi:hypothetical protein
MAADNPTAYHPDFMAKAKADRDSTQTGGAPKFETLLILGKLGQHNSLSKKELVSFCLEQMGLELTEERVYLAYIHSLVSLGYIVKSDSEFYLTPRGRDRNLALREEMNSALKTVAIAFS